MAPLFWGISRKDKRFVVTVRMGPHRKDRSIPAAVLLRDTLRMVSTLREAKAAIYSGAVTVDGVRRKSLHHGVGLMDAVELAGVDGAYRMLPSGGALLRPVKIDAGEKSKKVCRVTGKTTIRGGRTQIGFHDGRSLVSDEDVRVGDSCLLQVPEQKILEVIRLEKGAHAIVTSGVNAGQAGTVAEVSDGTFVLPRRARVKLGDREIEIPADILMAVGRDGPAVRVG